MKKRCRWALRTVSSPTYTPTQLHNELRHQGYDVVIIDYLNLFKQVHKDLWQSLYMHTKYLKMMAKELGVLVYVLAQLNDEGRAKYGKAAEEDADAWLYWDIQVGSPRVQIFHGKARHYKPYPFELIFDYPNLGFIEESDLGLSCKRCGHNFFPADTKQRIEEKTDEIKRLRKRGSDEEADDLEDQIPYLEQDRCPYCVGKEFPRGPRLVPQIDQLKAIAKADAEEQEKARQAVEAKNKRDEDKKRDRENKGSNDQDRRQDEGEDDGDEDAQDETE